MLYHEKDKQTNAKNEHHGHKQPPHEYGVPENEPYISENGSEYHDEILSVFADEIFPNDDLGL